MGNTTGDMAVVEQPADTVLTKQEADVAQKLEQAAGTGTEARDA